MRGWTIAVVVVAVIWWCVLLVVVVVVVVVRGGDGATPQRGGEPTTMNCNGATSKRSLLIALSPPSLSSPLASCSQKSVCVRACVRE